MDERETKIATGASQKIWSLVRKCSTPAQLQVITYEQIHQNLVDNLWAYVSLWRRLYAAWGDKFTIYHAKNRPYINIKKMYCSPLNMRQYEPANFFHPRMYISTQHHLRLFFSPSHDWLWAHQPISGQPIGPITWESKTKKWCTGEGRLFPFIYSSSITTYQR